MASLANGVLAQCIFVVDILTHAYMFFHQFEYYRTSMRKNLAIIPPRPHALLVPSRSPAPDISYWYRPHTSQTEVPILFLHGIGVGLYPYMEFLKELNHGRTVEEGDIGVLAIEILPISSRFTSAALRKEAMCDQIRTIVDRCGIDKFCLVAHSFVVPAQVRKSMTDDEQIWFSDHHAHASNAGPR